MNLREYINEPSPVHDELKHFFNPAEAMIIFDIGACEGEDSIKYNKLFPKSRIFSFEPLPGNIRKLNNNLRTYGVSNKVEVVQCALSDNDGEAVFHVSSGTPENCINNEEWNYGNKSSSLFPQGNGLKNHYPWLNFDEQIEVKTVRVDTFCNPQINKIDFAHIDVQGAELMVLNGFGKYLAKTKMIVLEVEKVELYKGQPLVNDIEIFMKKNGFIKLKEMVSSISGDQIYLNSAIVSPRSVALYRLKKIVSKVLSRIA